MTKQDVVNEVVKSTGIDKFTVQKTLESFMYTVKGSMVKNKTIYLRGFGTFLLRKRAKKIARDISKNTAVIVPEHYKPTFKPSKEFVAKVKANVKS